MSSLSLPRPRSAGPSAAGALLDEFGLPDQAPEEHLRALTRVAAALCEVPTAVVNLLGDCYQHQVGSFGFLAADSPRSDSLCALALQEPRLRHVPDTLDEPAFAASAWVDGRLARVRFYASAPLLLPDGRLLGSLCVFSDRPHTLTSVKQQALQDLAAQAVALIVHAREARDAARQASLFRLVAEGSADVLSRHSPDGTVLYVSPSVRSVLGYEPYDEIGSAAPHRVHEDDRGAMAEAMLSVVLGSAGAATATVRARHADGSWRWLETRLAPIRGEDGRVLELHSAARDVTERVLAERGLAQAAEQVRGIVESCVDALVALDEDGLVVDWNSQAETTFGWSRAEALGRDLAGLVVPVELREAHRAGMARLRAGAGGRLLGQRLQLPAVRKDGSRLPVDLTVWRSPWDGGWRYHAFLRDVTDREQAQAALRRAHDDLADREDFLSAVLESTQAGIVACDDRGRLTLFNEKTRSWHGLDADAGLDPSSWSSAYALFGDDGVTPLPEGGVPLVRALHDGQVVDVEIVIRPVSGEAIRVLCQGRRLQDGDRVLGAVVVMHDITTLRERERALGVARDEALAATRAKTAFLAAASHEIRTPLNGVLGTLELLAALSPSPRQRELVGVARDSGEALLRLLNDVLDLSKAETTSVVLAAEPLVPSDVAAEVCRAMLPVAVRKGLALHLATDPASGQTLVGDPGRLRQVLMNLVGNAVKFTGLGSVSIHIGVEAADPTPDGQRQALLRASVTDTGAGMDGDELARLFQPFVQGVQGQRYGGTGLGLALSQQIVDLMGGAIEVDSAAGTGSTFSVVVTLPVAVAAQHDPRDEQDRRGSQQHRPVRVLVADDSPVNLMVVEGLLQAEGAEVVTVEDGDDAVAAVAEGGFDLVLLDNHMPRMSGPEAARAIRRLSGAPGSTRLVALTASAGADEEAELRAAGVDDVLLKPVRGEDLRGAISAARYAELESTAGRYR